MCLTTPWPYEPWVCHFPIGILGQVWYLIVSIPDLYNLITMTWDFQQCKMCDQQRLRPAAHTRRLIRAFASRLVSAKLLPEHHLEFLGLIGGCTGSSESTLVKILHCWKSHVVDHIYIQYTFHEYPYTGCRVMAWHWYYGQQRAKSPLKLDILTKPRRGHIYSGISLMKCPS